MSSFKVSFEKRNQDIELKRDIVPIISLGGIQAVEEFKQRLNKPYTHHWFEVAADDYCSAIKMTKKGTFEEQRIGKQNAEHAKEKYIKVYMDSFEIGATLEAYYQLFPEYRSEYIKENGSPYKVRGSMHDMLNIARAALPDNFKEQYNEAIEIGREMASMDFERTVAKQNREQYSSLEPRQGSWVAKIQAERENKTTEVTR